MCKLYNIGERVVINFSFEDFLREGRLDFGTVIKSEYSEECVFEDEEPIYTEKVIVRGDNGRVYASYKSDLTPSSIDHFMNKEEFSKRLLYEENVMKERMIAISTIRSKIQRGI